MIEQPARWGDKGATIVEFAFVGPVLFALLFIFMDFSLVIAGNSAGSNGARDGARVGSIQYVDADDPTSVNGQAVRDAVLARLENLVQGTPTITVTCIKADSGNTIPCQRAIGGSGGVEENRDLIQVQLDWTHLSITPFLSSDHTETVRTTITGEPDFSPDAAPLAVFFDDPDADGIAQNQDVDEPVGVENVIIRRSGDSTPALTLTLGPGIGTTAQPADYVIPSPVVMASGVDQIIVPIGIVDDPFVEEPDEIVVVEINGMTAVPVTADAIVGLPQTVRISIDSEDVDDVPPAPTANRRFVEATGSIDGRVDFLRIHFNETIATLGSWTAVDIPAGASLGAPQLGGDGQTVNLPVSWQSGTGTTGGPFVVSATGVADAVGNSAPTGPLTLRDEANPVLVSVPTTQPGGGTQGLPETGDVLAFTFSEPVIVGAINQLDLINSGSNDLVSIPGLLGSTSATGGNYLKGSSPVTFAASAVVSGNQVLVTLGSCSSNCTSPAAVGGSPNLGFVLSGPTDAALLPALMPSTAITQILF